MAWLMKSSPLSMEETLLAVDVVLILEGKQERVPKVVLQAGRRVRADLIGLCSFSLIPMALPRNFSRAINGNVLCEGHQTAGTGTIPPPLQVDIRDWFFSPVARVPARH